MIREWWKLRKERQIEKDRQWVEKAMLKHDVSAEEVVQAVTGEWDDSVPDRVAFEDDHEYAYYDHEQEYEHARSRSRVGLFVALGMVGLVFGLVICGFSYLANSADSAGPKADSGMEALKASIAPTPSVNPLLNGTHIAFTYPSAFDVVTHPQSWANTDERYTLSSKTDYRKTIQVYVEQIVNPTMDSGFVVRSQHKDQYTPASITVAGEPAVVMVKSDYSERTLYWEHAGNLVIMSATGGGNDMASWISMIAHSLRWLK
jgi:hypothetical protein